jgi:hypothetical protein
MYRISSVVIVPVILLYIVIVVTSFSNVVSLMFIYSLFVWIGMIINSVCDVINAVRIILLDAENIWLNTVIVVTSFSNVVS